MGRACLAWLFVLSLQAWAGSDAPLLEAAKNGDYEAVRARLYSAADVDSAGPDGTTALHWAALHDDLELASLLLQSGAKADPANDYGATPLWLACTNRSAGMARILLQAGADPDAALWNGETPLMNCARTGAAETVVALLAAGAAVNAFEKNQGQTALMWAVAQGHSKLTRLLIDHGADIAATTISTYTTTPHTCRICPWVPASGGFTPLLFAARSGDMDSARMLVEAGADPDEASDEHGNTLVIASASGHEALALYLLERGADPNSADETGITALHHAVGAGLSVLNGVIYDPVYRRRPLNSRELAGALLDAGADPNARIAREHLLGPDGYPFSMEGATPFLLAAASADVPMMQLLREAGADPTLKSSEDVTPLIAAAQYACTGTCAYQEGGNASPDREDIQAALQAVKALVESGAEIHAAEDSGRTALHMAAFTGADAVVQYLVARGASVNARDNNGETPWSMASGLSPRNSSGQYGVHEGTAAILLDLGAERISAQDLESRY